MSLRVLRAGAGCSIQDFGRVGYGRFGVPRSGAFDLESLSLANSLLDNERFAPALEISFAGLSLMNEGEAITLALGGAPCMVLVDDLPVAQGVVNVPAAATLEITHVRAARVYIALMGGVEV